MAKDGAVASTSIALIPRAVQSSDGGFTLYDTTTGEEIATAPDWESATRVATTHANMVEERDSDRIAAVASAYQAAQFSGDWSKLNKQQTETRLDLGTSENTKQAAARSEDHRQRVESQELLDGGDGSVTRAVLGESRTTFEEGQARTVNRILDGGSILTIFHEEAHGFHRRAHQNRSLTIADDIAILRAVDTVLAGKTTREGDKQLRLLPENFDTLSPKDQETAIDEGISRLMEAEVLRTRKGGGVRELPAGIISNNLAALSRLAGDKSVGKFRAFIRAVRALRAGNRPGERDPAWVGGWVDPSGGLS
ncbi:MAG: hypothetical protein EOP84_02295 [Verrucomicrobiaceae bacterium]|nr:MAG: hypothetical protein EOP84_02295 [Verrucomicrobiaceae bacterium]